MAIAWKYHGNSVYCFGFFTPYLDLEVILLATPAKSNVPLTKWYLIPGVSCTLPPLTNTILCSDKLWPSPGINAEMTFPLDNLTLQHFRNAELGFFGLTIITLNTTPFLKGEFCKSGALEFLRLFGNPCFPILTWFRLANLTWSNFMVGNGLGNNPAEYEVTLGEIGRDNPFKPKDAIGDITARAEPNILANMMG
jgi:hypothetical protein